MEQSVLERRFELLKELGANVLPLAEGLERMQAGTLPEAAVAITFDDGAYDFFARAAPLIDRYGYPVTVYWTTYYADRPWPVFDTMLSYLLWKADALTLHWPEVLGDEAYDLQSLATRQRLETLLRQYTANQRLSGSQKNDLLELLAGKLGVNYGELLRQRLLQIMTSEEAKSLPARGIELQLHTHRHRMSLREDLLVRELTDNRATIKAVADNSSWHFCYPSGHYRPEFAAVLRANGVASATTCNLGLADARSGLFDLPRFLDSSSVTEDEFTAWVSGFAEQLPQRYAVSPDPPLLEDAPHD